MQSALTEAQLMQIIHSSYEGNRSGPTSTDEEYLARRDILNAAILNWDMYKSTLWNELWVPLSSGDGTTSITDYTDKTYTLPSDFRFLSDIIRVTRSTGEVIKFKKIQPHNKHLYADSSKVFYITGNQKLGYTLNFMPSGLEIADNSGVISGEYYKRPTIISATTDVPEVSNPNYLVKYLLAYLYRQDDNEDAFQREMAEARDLLAQMQVTNMMSSWHEEDRILDGELDINGVEGFGL